MLLTYVAVSSSLSHYYSRFLTYFKFQRERHFFSFLMTSVLSEFNKVIFVSCTRKTTVCMHLYCISVYYVYYVMFVWFLRLMKRMYNCCTLASVSALVILVVFPEMSCSKLDRYDTQTESDVRCCVVQDISVRRYEDIDQDSFVSLFGRRSAPPKPIRILDRIFAGLLRKTSEEIQKGFALTKDQPRRSYEPREVMDVFVEK
ncbi:hypothetical protein WMY93_031868 [Mugilogobius chulae]|uniref:Uncharacterized protein n=1 Tax=Mugilogobius chulae TaxID=88201 RepID=A0AAW0MGX9_9GOBI